MQVATLIVTRRCNQTCAFCARVAQSSTDPSLAELAGQIERSASDGARRLVVTGGEPLAREDLLELVRRARSAGFTQVALETNATAIGSLQRALELANAGVTHAQVSVVSTNGAVHLAITGARTTPRHVVRGISHLLAAGVPVSVRLPIAAGVPSAAARISGLSRALPGVERYVLAPVGPREATVVPNRALAPQALAREIEDAYREAARARVELAVSGEHPLLPCVHPIELPRARRLFAGLLGKTERERPNDACAACASCALRMRCNASSDDVDAAAHGVAPVPVEDAGAFLRPGRSAGSRLHVLRERDLDQFLHVDYEWGVDVGRPTSRVGIVYRCNQVCTFCNLADMDVDVSAERVRAAIDESRARGSTRLILTGGEPTLSRELREHIAYARERGFEMIEVQTNAILLDRPGFARELRAAGLTHAQVSLHGPDPALSDRHTAAPGTHARTLRGIDALLDAGIDVLLNHLCFRDVCHLVSDFVELCETRWGAHRERVTIQFRAPRNEFATREEALREIAPYSEYVADLRAGIDRARALGFRANDLADPTGIPALCVGGADPRYSGPIAPQAAAPRLHNFEREWMTYGRACEHCALAHACMGVPKYYLELFGETELRPFTPDEARARGVEPVDGPDTSATSTGEGDARRRRLRVAP